MRFFKIFITLSTIISLYNVTIEASKRKLPYKRGHELKKSCIRNDEQKTTFKASADKENKSPNSLDDLSAMLQMFSLTKDTLLLPNILAAIPADKQPYFVKFDTKILQWTLENGYSDIIEEFLVNKDEKSFATATTKSLTHAATMGHIVFLKSWLNNPATRICISDELLHDLINSKATANSSKDILKKALFAIRIEVIK